MESGAELNLSLELVTEAQTARDSSPEVLGGTGSVRGDVSGNMGHFWLVRLKRVPAFVLGA